MLTVVGKSGRLIFFAVSVLLTSLFSRSVSLIFHKTHISAFTLVQPASLEVNKSSLTNYLLFMWKFLSVSLPWMKEEWQTMFRIHPLVLYHLDRNRKLIISQIFQGDLLRQVHFSCQKFGGGEKDQDVREP